MVKKHHKNKRNQAEFLPASQAAYELNLSGEELALLYSSGLVKVKSLFTDEGIKQLQETSLFNAYLLLRMAGLIQAEDARMTDFLKTATTYYESRYRADETKDQVRDLIKIFGETEIDYWALREKLRARGAKNLDEAIKLSKVAFVIRNEHIPGYELIKYLGEGKSRRVYLARIKNSKALVKIKIYQPTTESRQQIERRERKSLSRIVREEFATLLKFEHYSGVTAYFDYGPRGLRRLFGRKQFYIVGEYIVGQNLEEAAPTLTMPEKLGIFCKVANTVKSIHENGCVIRDLKLDNIMLSEDKREVKIDDLEMITGLADILTEKAFGSTRGSDRYAAPELIRGERATIGTDMYALAACLFYLLEGKQRASGFEDANYLPREQYENFLDQQLVKLVDKIRTEKRFEVRVIGEGPKKLGEHLANIVYYLRRNLSFASQERGGYEFEELSKEEQKYVMEWVEKTREGNDIPFRLSSPKSARNEYEYINPNLLPHYNCSFKL